MERWIVAISITDLKVETDLIAAALYYEEYGCFRQKYDGLKSHKVLQDVPFLYLITMLLLIRMWKYLDCKIDLINLIPN